MIRQERSAQGIDVEDNVWLGAHVVVADGVTVGRDAIVGAGAVVNTDVPAYHVRGGRAGQSRARPPGLNRDRQHGRQSSTGTRSQASPSVNSRAAKHQMTSRLPVQ